MAKVWTRIRQTLERHAGAALLSVVGAAGSVPRESGTRIVLQPDGGFFGSIGGAPGIRGDCGGARRAGGRARVYFVEPLTDSFTLQEIAVKATPLVMIAVGLSLCYIANIWNIGAEGCLDARHARAVLRMQLNKTDRK